jgi:hypothetical protein
MIERLRTAPQILILGSSSAREIEPRAITRATGKSAFNASVSAGIPRDALAFARFTADSVAGDVETIVYAVDVEAFRTEGDFATINKVPELHRYARTAPATTRDHIATTRTRIQELLSYSTLKASVTTLRAAVRDAAPGVTGDSADDVIAADGFRVTSPFADRAVDVEFQIRNQAEAYEDWLYKGRQFTALDSDEVAAFTALARDAHRRKQRLLVILMPTAELLRDRLDDKGRRDRVADVRASVDIADLADLDEYDGTRVVTYDGVHMPPETSTAIVLSALDTIR